MMHQIMLCRQLHIGGIVAAGAGFVSVPALFRTGRSFCCVLLQIMVQRGLLCIGGIVAVFAGIVGVPALFRTGRGFCCVLHQSMVIGVFFAVFPTTHLTDRFGGAGCCATGTACGLNFGAARAAAGVRAVAVRRPRAPVVTENAVFRAAFFTDFSCDAGGGLGAAGMPRKISINDLVLPAADCAFYMNPMIV